MWKKPFFLVLYSSRFLINQMFSMSRHKEKDNFMSKSRQYLHIFICEHVNRHFGLSVSGVNFYHILHTWPVDSIERRTVKLCSFFEYDKSKKKYDCMRRILYKSCEITIFYRKSQTRIEIMMKLILNQSFIAMRNQSNREKKMKKI